MDWIPGYQISGSAPTQGLHSPSGEKIAAIAKMYDGAFKVMSLVPELDDVDVSDAVSAEAACTILIHEHAKHLRVVPLLDLRDAANHIAQQIIQVSGDNNRIETTQSVEKKINEADTKTLLQVIKEILPRAVTATGAGASALAALKAILGL